MFNQNNGKLVVHFALISAAGSFKSAFVGSDSIKYSGLRIFVKIFDFKNMFLRCKRKLIFVVSLWVNSSGKLL